jgi:hypothetical protein
MKEIARRIRRTGNWLTGVIASPYARRSLMRRFDHPGKAPSTRLLFVASFDPEGLKSISENIREWCQTSRFRFDLLNLSDFPGRSGLTIPGWIDLKVYSGIVLHCTTSYSPENLNTLDRRIRTKFSEYEGLKILMKQDEHYRAHEIASYVKSQRFDLLITLAEPDRVREIYPRERIGDVDFLFAHTGYVSQEMRQIGAPPLSARPVDVGYRGSIQPLNFGLLAFEKREIGDRFSVVCAEKGLTHDISSRWEDRFLGDAWVEFLCRIKATLGVESGASIVDFDGEVERKVKDFLRSHPAARFQELYASVLKPYEDNAYYKAISPRHLEAAACKTVQVLYEGRYSGIFHADRHYIPLRRDFTNIDDVVRRMRDIPRCQDMVDCAFEEVILDPHYSYDAFVSEFDDRVAQMLAAKGGAR